MAEAPAVVLLGPPQSGKANLALAVAEGRDAVCLDLESERDRAKLTEPELYLSDHLDRLVVLDEIHLAPERRFVVYPGEEAYPISEGIQAIPLPALARTLAEAGP